MAFSFALVLVCMYLDEFATKRRPNYPPLLMGVLNYLVKCNVTIMSIC